MKIIKGEFTWMTRELLSLLYYSTLFVETQRRILNFNQRENNSSTNSNRESCFHRLFVNYIIHLYRSSAIVIIPRFPPRAIVFSFSFLHSTCDIQCTESRSVTCRSHGKFSSLFFLTRISLL